MSKSQKGASPKSPRYFFSNPVHALSAMLDHGIKIIGHNPQNIADWMSGIACEDWAGRPWYIADESLPMLKVRAGDLIRCDQYHDAISVHRSEDGLYISWDTYMDGGDSCKVENLTGVVIIQRNGKPFFWPESEEI